MSAPVRLQDVAPDRARFRDDVWHGLSLPRKTLPCKYFYDARGSALFEAICELPEYYPTRTELSIMERHAGDMAARLGARCLLVEYGSGSSRKTRLLLDRLEAPAGYVPIDISRTALAASARALTDAYPALEVLPVCADYTEPFDLPHPQRTPLRRAVYFPGSTIGNFTPPEVASFLARMARVAGRRGALLVGVDLKKERAVLEAAYDDAAGVTAAFNRNLLVRINRELGGEFDLARFAHRARWDEQAGRVEMHLVADRAHSVRVAGRAFSFARGETIHTENSYKFDLAQFAALAAGAGLAVREVWTDDARRFSVQLLSVEA
ncbi:MAG: L-histidine N(alpha)-methyltransferase [Proteobacteria bacterium]|nr:MAG: L-histidine N(alpha)-methyltransferase [Pseudomonadota bacterium]